MTFKIVLIDDDKDTGRLLDRVFHRYDVEILHALNGKDGLEMVVANSPELVLLDQKMEGMNGLDVLKVIRKHPAFSELPVFFLTACADEETKMAAVEAGATGFYTKPFAPFELAEDMMNVIRAAAA